MYFGRVTNWILLVVLNSGVQRAKVDVTATFVFFEFVQEFSCICSSTIKESLGFSGSTISKSKSLSNFWNSLFLFN